MKKEKREGKFLPGRWRSPAIFFPERGDDHPFLLPWKVKNGGGKGGKKGERGKGEVRRLFFSSEGEREKKKKEKEGYALY